MFLAVARGTGPDNTSFYRQVRRLGWRTLAFDEEGLVYRSGEVFLRSRFSLETAAEVDGLMAWGPENARLWESAIPGDSPPVFVTGNPRFDLLRPEFAHYHQPDVDALQARFGRFVLINGNFSLANHWNASRGVLSGWFADATARRKIGAETARYTAHQARLMRVFLELLPELPRRFPDTTFVLRPHPSENHEPWRQAAAGLERVHVVHEGNVIPWLLAASCLLHNGCRPPS